MECAHENVQMHCDGHQHTFYCGDCEDDLSYESCPEEGTFPTDCEDEEKP